MMILEALATAAVARLVAAGLAGGNVEKHRDPPTQDDELPLANVTYGDDRGVADGDPRTGTADFVHTLTLAIDVVDTATSGAALMAQIALHGERIMQALCADLSWHKDIEGIGGARQVIEKSPEGAKIAYRLQVQLDVLYRSQWEPSTDGLPYLTHVSIDAGDDVGANIEVPHA